MKTLHLLRHAKSAWNDPATADRERGLKARGQRDAQRMGRALAARISPMVVHASPARRAQLTLAGLCAGWPRLAEMPHREVEALYTFAADDLHRWIVHQDGDCPALCILAHNPALTELVNDLVGYRCLDNLPTAGYVELALDIDRWEALGHGDAELVQHVFPRDLPDD